MSALQEQVAHYSEIRKRLYNPTVTKFRAKVLDKPTLNPAGNTEPSVVKFPVSFRADANTEIKTLEQWIVELQSAARPQVITIQKAVASFYNVTMIDLLSHRRDRGIVLPRQIGMYLSKKLTLRSLVDIADRFGGRDHTTCLHAVRKIDQLRQADAALSADLDKIAASLLAA